MSRARYRLLVLAPSLAIAGLLLLPAQGDAIFGCGIDPLCMIGKGIGGAVSSVAGDAITALAKSVLGALGHAVEWASTLWVGIGTPPVADASGQATGTVAFLQQNLLVFTTGLAVLCTLLGAGRIVYHEHKSAQLRELGRYLATYVLISGAAAGAASVLIGGCDQMASWFIARASSGSGFADHLANLLGLATVGTSHAAGAPAGFTVGLAGTVTTAFIAIVLGIIAFLATVIQIMLMLVRGGHAGPAGGDAAAGRRVLEHGDGVAVVPQGLGVAARVRLVQAGGRGRVRGRVRSRGSAGRAGAAGRGDDAGARDPRAAGFAAVRGAGDERADGRRRVGGDARRRGRRRDRDADADRRRVGRSDPRERLRPGARRWRAFGCGARGRRLAWPGGQ